MTFKAWLIIAAELLLSVIVIYVLLGQVGDANKRADDAEHNLKLANDTIADMQTRQREVAALDAKYTVALADAKETIERLRSDVASGAKRLRVAANCPVGASGTGGLGDASSPRLTDSAQRDYFTLRERIETVTKQVGYLQDFIKQQCLKQNDAL